MRAGCFIRWKCSLALLAGGWLLGSVCSGEEMNVELGVIRFRPVHQQDLLRSGGPMLRAYSGKGPAPGNLRSVSAILEKAGTADTLVSTNFHYALEHTNVLVKESYALRTLVAGEKLPEVIKVSLQLGLEIRPRAAGQYELRWGGQLQWSPELIDYLAGRPMRFKESFALDNSDSKQKRIELSKGAASFQRTGMDLIKSVVVREDSAVFELPVVKSLSLSGSKLARMGQPVLEATTAESGGGSSQEMILVLILQSADMSAGKRK